MVVRRLTNSVDQFGRSRDRQAGSGLRVPPPRTINNEGVPLVPAHRRRLSKLRSHIFSIAAGVIFAVVLTGVALGPTLRHTGDAADAAAPAVDTGDDRDQAASRNMVRGAAPTATPAAPTSATAAPKPS